MVRGGMRFLAHPWKKRIKMRNSFGEKSPGSLKGPEVRVKTSSPLLAEFLFICHSKPGAPAEKEKHCHSRPSRSAVRGEAHLCLCSGLDAPETLCFNLGQCGLLPAHQSHTNNHDDNAKPFTLLWFARDLWFVQIVGMFS